MARSSKLKRGTRSSFLIIMNSPWAIANVVKKRSQNASHQHQVTQPLQGALPEPDRPGDLWVSRQPIRLGPVGVSEDVDNVRTAHPGRIVHTCLLEPVGSELFGPAFSLV